MALLGCGEYRATINGPGGSPTLWDIPYTSGYWERLLDDVSTASVTVPMTAACCADLTSRLTLDASLYELTIYRDLDVVWQGPITYISDTGRSGELVLTGSDLLFWTQRKRAQSSSVYSGSYQQIVNDALDEWFAGPSSGGDPGLTPYVVIVSETGSLSHTFEVDDLLYEDLIQEFVDQRRLAVTTVGRSIVLSAPVVYADIETVNYPILQEKHIVDQVQTVIAGQETVTRATVFYDSGASSAHAQISPSIYPTTIDNMDEVTADSLSLAQDAAEAIVQGGYPTPRYMIVPDGARLTPDAPLTIEQLVCGQIMQIQILDRCVPISQMMQLERVRTTFSADQPEAVAISVGPVLSSTEVV